MAEECEQYDEQARLIQDALQEETPFLGSNRSRMRTQSSITAVIREFIRDLELLGTILSHNSAIITHLYSHYNASSGGNELVSQCNQL